MKTVKGTSGTKGDKVKAKPLVRKYAKAKGVNINDVTGSGPNGTVTKDDIDSFLSQDRIEPDTIVHAPPPVHQPPPPQAVKSLPIRGMFNCISGI